MSDYRLDDLGWFQFERLCQSLLKARHGLRLEAWGGSSDLGRDAYAKGPLRHPGDEENDGPFVFQAKFVAGANSSGAEPMGPLMDAVGKELRKIRERNAAGKWEEPAYYTLLTNVPLDSGRRETVEERLEAGLPDTEILVQGGADIDALLDDSPAVRLSFPQILGLRDIFTLLEQSVHREIVTRSRGALKMSTELAKTFVPTVAYGRALDVLGARRFVVLTGPPEMGKTTIARMIALARLSEEWEAYECRGPDDLLKVHDPEKPQVFVADDAFGSTEYQPAKGNVWADELDGVIRMLDSQHWLLLTSRPAPLRTALERLHLQGAAKGFPSPQEVLVDASELRIDEKAQMLYRHAKNAVEETEGRALIAAHAERIVGHEHFTPLRIHRFVTEQLPEILGQPAELHEELMQTAVTTGMETSTSEMKTSFAMLPEDCQALMIAMLDCGEVPIELNFLGPAFERHLGQVPRRSVQSTATIVDAHFVRLRTWPRGDDEPVDVEWVHPSVRDLVIDHLMEDARARRDFLTKSGIDGLMLALSSAGGAEGERQFPLMHGDKEWEQLKRRLTELANGDAVESHWLLALASDTARLSESADARTAGRLREVTRLILGQLRERWSADAKALPVHNLRELRRIGQSLAAPVELPDVVPTWNALVAQVDAGRGFIDDRLSVAEEWLDLANLLESYDPELLSRLSFPEQHFDRLEGIVEMVEEESEQLGAPLVMDESDPDEYLDDVPNLDWLGGLEDLLGSVVRHAPALESHRDHVLTRIFDSAAEWEEYDEQQKAMTEPDPDYDRDDYSRGFGDSHDSFSVSELFSDL